MPLEALALRAEARVPDDYSTALRVLGLYPLTRFAFAAGIADWQRRTRQVFAMPAAELPQAGQLQRYTPAVVPPELVPPPRSAAFALATPSRPASSPPGLAGQPCGTAWRRASGRPATA